ncbi:hypothetical protein HBH69_062310 [Parastagonospora nodorum]|nr:hypothetical protein HBH69_062310 [Parastagonospora nodorum]
MGGSHKKPRRNASESDTSDTVAKTKTSRGGKQTKPKSRVSEKDAYEAKLNHLAAMATSQEHRDARESRRKVREARSRKAGSSSFVVDSDSSVHVKKPKKSAKKTKHEAPPPSDSDSDSDSDSPVPARKSTRSAKSDKSTKKKAQPDSSDSDSESSSDSLVPVRKSMRSAKSNKSTKKKAQPDSSSDSDSPVPVRKSTTSTKSKKSTKKTKREAQPPTESDSSSDSPVPVKKDKKKSTKKAVEPSSESESEDLFDSRTERKSSKKQTKPRPRRRDGSQSDASNPPLPQGRPVDLRIRKLNKSSIKTFAGAAKGHDSNTSGAIALRPKEHPSVAQIREALALDPRDDVEIGPEGFGAQKDGDSIRIVFASRYGATKGCQMDLCGAAFMLSGICPEGINCTLVHIWPSLACMVYLATQPSEWGREAFKKFCAEYHPIWLRNWNKFYKNDARTEPLPSLPVTAWLGPRSHTGAAKKALERQNGQKNRNSEAGDANGQAKPPPVTPRGHSIYGSRLGAVNPVNGLRAMVEGQPTHNIRQPSQDMAEAVSDPTAQGRYDTGSFIQKKKDWNDPVLFKQKDALENAKKKALADAADERIARGAPLVSMSQTQKAGPSGDRKTKTFLMSTRRPDFSKMTADDVIALGMELKNEEIESYKDEADNDSGVESFPEDSGVESFPEDSGSEDIVFEAPAPVPKITVPVIPEPFPQPSAPSAHKSEHSSKKEEKKEEKKKKEKKASSSSQEATAEDAIEE